MTASILHRRWLLVSDVGVAAGQAVLFVLLSHFRDSVVNFRSAVWQFQASTYATLLSIAFGLCVFTAGNNDSWAFIVVKSVGLSVATLAVIVLVLCYDYVVTIASLALLVSTCR